MCSCRNLPLFYCFLFIFHFFLFLLKNYVNIVCDTLLSSAVRWTYRNKDSSMAIFYKRKFIFIESVLKLCIIHGIASLSIPQHRSSQSFYSFPEVQRSARSFVSKLKDHTVDQLLITIRFKVIIQCQTENGLYFFASCVDVTISIPFHE